MSPDPEAAQSTRIFAETGKAAIQNQAERVRRLSSQVVVVLPRAKPTGTSLRALGLGE